MAANVVLSFNQITFQIGLLFSLSGARIHYRKHCRGKVTVVSTPVRATTKVLTGLGLRFFSSGQLSLKRRQQRLGGEHVRSSDIAGSGKFRLHQLHLANGHAWP